MNGRDAISKRMGQKGYQFGPTLVTRLLADCYHGRPLDDVQKTVLTEINRFLKEEIVAKAEN